MSGDETLKSAGTTIREAYGAALAAGERTRDLGGSLGTEAFADAVIARSGG